MKTHINDMLPGAASSLPALRVLGSHGLKPQVLQEVATVTTVTSHLQVSPAWWGFKQVGKRARIEQLINEMKS